MKLIILTLLFTFNSYAQHKVTIEKSGEATMSFEEKTLNKAIKRLKKIILSKSRFKGEWSIEQSGYIFDRTNREDIKEYYKPLNFSVVVEDITDLLAEKKAKKDARDKKIKDLRDKLETEDLTLKEINELLRSE